MSRGGTGRPLRFLAVLIGGWTTARVVLLWPAVESVPDPLRAIESPADARAEARVAAPLPVTMPVTGVARPVRVRAIPTSSTGVLALPAARGSEPERIAIALAAPVQVGGDRSIAAAPAIPPPLRPTPVANAPNRLAASAWAIVRGGTRAGLLGGQLGASQAGVRVTYGIGDAQRFALAARLAAPLEGKGREAAIGVEWRPAGLPVRVIAEQRVSLDGGRGGPTLGIVGGIGPVEMAPGFRLEAYGQAGAIAREQIERFADGAARLSRVVGMADGIRLDLGVGMWGGAQRGAARLDAGPSAGLSLPVGERALRLTLDWRHRIAGEARPGSGPALSIGSDF